MRFAAASFFHPAALLARYENLYGVSQPPPSQFIRYRDPRRVASLGPSTLAIAFGLFYGDGIKARVFFSSRGLRRTSHGNWFNEQGGMGRDFVDVADVITSRAQ